MKGLLIIGKKGGMNGSPMSDSGAYDDDGDEEMADKEEGDDFGDVFTSFCQALGIEPEDKEKAAKRLKTLMMIACKKYM